MRNGSGGRVLGWVLLALAGLGLLAEALFQERLRPELQQVLAVVLLALFAAGFVLLARGGRR